MGYARYVGRVGALAVALGIGVAVATGQGMGMARADDSPPADPPSAPSDPSPGTPPADPSGDLEPADATVGYADTEEHVRRAAVGTGPHPVGPGHELQQLRWRPHLW